VSGIITLPNNTKVVMVRHGDYISVYSNLSKVFVKKKEKLKTKSIIGYIYKSDREETSILDFQIWQENKKLNPESWLIKN
jgi:septal ring factor EnvC (AmiA/AmiB activator)